jgi:carbonic anhydrase
MVLLAIVFVAAPTAEGPSPRESLAKLKAGNAVFVANPADALPIDAAARAAAVKGRTPFAAVLSCADAAVPPEVIFHVGLGDLFVVRAAGPVADRAVLASLEYAVEALRVPLIVVMGHEACGIVRTGLEGSDGAKVGSNFAHLLKRMRPVADHHDVPADAARVRQTILEHVEEQINVLLQESTTIKSRVHESRVAIVGGYYELLSGVVHISEPIRVLHTAEAANQH